MRYFLLESCRPRDKYLLSVGDDFDGKLTKEGDFYMERVMLGYWWNLSYDMSGCMRKHVVTS